MNQTLRMYQTVNGVYEYVQTNYPMAIAAINDADPSEVLPDIHTYQLSNVPDKTVDSCLTCYVNGVSYLGVTNGVEGVSVELVFSIDFQANDMTKSNTKALKYIDAFQNMHFADTTFGGVVDKSDLVRATMIPTINKGWIDFTLNVSYELL